MAVPEMRYEATWGQRNTADSKQPVSPLYSRRVHAIYAYLATRKYS